MQQFAPCFKCQNSNAKQMSFTWWGGLIGPKILTHVKCQTCGNTYNGKTGKDNTTNIVIYFAVIFILAAILVGLFAVLAVLLNMPR